MNRARRGGGFTLIEALVTLLVLGIGLLGLGQLQAQLWRSSGDLHASQGAFLLAHDLLESRPLEWLPATADGPLPHGKEIRYTYEITENNPQPSISALTTTRLELHWRDASGARALLLTTTRNTGIDPADARWLLTSP